MNHYYDDKGVDQSYGGRAPAKKHDRGTLKRIREMRKYPIGPTVKRSVVSDRNKWANMHEDPSLRSVKKIEKT